MHMTNPGVVILTECVFGHIDIFIGPSLLWNADKIEQNQEVSRLPANLPSNTPVG
jgi:hypothetical protein